MAASRKKADFLFVKWSLAIGYEVTKPFDTLFLQSLNNTDHLTTTPFPPSTRPMAGSNSKMRWSEKFAVSKSPRSKQLPGDKILLPQSALEKLLSASANAAAESSRRDLPAYDPYNSATYSAYRQAESQYQDQRHQLPYPLTFRLVNPENGRVVHAGIREFSAEEDEAILSPFLLEALGIANAAEQNGSGEHGAENGDAVNHRVTIHVQELPKGTFVKLRPLEAGYDPDDWKALLEQHLRQEYTTLTNGEVLVVPGGRGVGGKKEEFRFLIDGFKPEGTEGVCIVDTDLEVDIEALNEDQARETMKRIAEKLSAGPGTGQGSSMGGEIDLFNAKQGQIVPGEYVDYELTSWNKALPLELELSGENDNDDVDLIVNPFSNTQRSKPRIDEHVFADFDGRPSKKIRLDPTNVELEGAESLSITVHAYAPSTDAQTNGHVGDHQSGQLRHYTLRARHVDSDDTMADASVDTTETPPNPEDVRCKNCGQWVPQRTLMLHENFCLRNNILCRQGCGQVFKKGSPEFESHWHCPHDAIYGNTALAQEKHNSLTHPPEVLRCSECSTAETFSSTHSLARHRTSTCPSKLILCRFCHLIVPQEGDPDVPNAEALLSGMTPHELADGARTTECHMCNKIVRLRDMDTHLKSHELDRLDRPTPHPCRNINCGRTQDTCAKNGDTRAGSRMGQGAGNDLGLCSVCYGPLYVSMHDPEGKAMRRRIERRYLQQLVTGCGKPWCRNEFCKIGRKARDLPANIAMKDGVPMVKPILESLAKGETASPLHFCVDEGSQKRRGLAELLAADETVGFGKGGYSFEWCLGALEAEKADLEGARKWLLDWAPTRSEERR